MASQSLSGETEALQHESDSLFRWNDSAAEWAWAPSSTLALSMLWSYWG